MNKFVKKMKKTYLKMLRAYSRGLIEKGYRLEDKWMRMELDTRESEVEEQKWTSKKDQA